MRNFIPAIINRFPYPLRIRIECNDRLHILEVNVNELHKG